MKLNLENKTAYVGGSSKGLGLASAKALSTLGATVILVGRSEDTLRQALSTLDTSKGQQHRYLMVDYSQPVEVKTAVQKLVSEGTTVHILVNNTGGPHPGPAIDMSPEDYASAFQTQMVNFQALVQAFVPGMKAAKYGRIINLTSTSTREPLTAMGLSNTIRAAVANWGKSLATELGPFGITVNNILPGMHRTDRSESLIASRVKATGNTEEQVEAAMLADIPAGRFGEPEDFGEVLAFLCTPSAGYINGIDLPVDGGKLKGL
jgi:3-oxoacyl-[acyl-carrier protein] reductase